MPTTIFDSSLITQRNRDKSIAQNVKQRNTAGLTIITPQTGYASYTISDVDNGQITNFRKVGQCTNVDLPCTCHTSILNNGISGNQLRSMISAVLLTDISSLGSQDILIYHRLFQVDYKGCGIPTNFIEFDITGTGTINWGDGTTESFNSIGITRVNHTYPVITYDAVDYIIGLTGTITYLNFSGINGTQFKVEGEGCNDLDSMEIQNVIINKGAGLLDLIVNTPKISGLNLCTSLRRLDLTSVTNFNVTELYGLPNLVILSLVGTTLQGTFDARGLSIGIQELNLRGNLITSIINMNSLPNLQIFSAQATKISDIDLSSNTALQLLDVGETNISTTSTQFLNSLPFLINLTHLGVYETNITDIDLTNNTKIQQLDISETGINPNSTQLQTSIPLLTTMFNLNISNTSITDLDISSNTSLTNLDVRNTNLQPNSLQFKNSLQNLINLSYLYVSNTSIDDIRLSSNTALGILSIENTNISDGSLQLIGSLGQTNMINLEISNTNLTQTGANAIAITLVTLGLSTELRTITIVDQKSGKIDITGASGGPWVTLVANGWTIT